MTDIVIVAATRTAIGKFGGALAKIPAPDLGAVVIRELLARGKLQPDQISEVILGQVLTRIALHRRRHGSHAGRRKVTRCKTGRPGSR
jgi:acetyl-CoA acetyltransferase